VVAATNCTYNICIDSNNSIQYYINTILPYTLISSTYKKYEDIRYLSVYSLFVIDDILLWYRIKDTYLVRSFYLNFFAFVSSSYI